MAPALAVLQPLMPAVGVRSSNLSRAPRGRAHTRATVSCTALAGRSAGGGGPFHCLPRSACSRRPRWVRRGGAGVFAQVRRGSAGVLALRPRRARGVGAPRRESLDEVTTTRSRCCGDLARVSEGDVQLGAVTIYSFRVTVPLDGMRAYELPDLVRECATK